ncbi:PASTA domain-containing protein [Kitasatospora hibisci]|uniref:PASTA domain-containing protein n=1 Tax=Kitasatospora hibisci TaxID=3369522 RepID=UPI00375495A7
MRRLRGGRPGPHRPRSRPRQRARRRPPQPPGPPGRLRRAERAGFGHPPGYRGRPAPVPRPLPPPAADPPLRRLRAAGRRADRPPGPGRSGRRPARSRPQGRRQQRRRCARPHHVRGTVSHRGAQHGPTLHRLHPARTVPDARPTTSPTTSPARRVTVPDLVGLDQEAAARKLQALGLAVDGDYTASNGVPELQIISTEPRAGAEVAPGSKVFLHISDGKATVPDVAGKTQDKAEQALRDAHFTNITVSTEPSTSTAAGLATRTDPVEGRSVGLKTPITLWIAYLPKPR